jgi:hypothetical protein
MALEDFAPEQVEPAQTRARAGTVGEDEDLFDFPGVEMDVAAHSLDEATTQEVDRLLAEDGLLFADPAVLDDENPVALAESLLARAFPAEPRRAQPDLQEAIDLDEDIFDFPLPDAPKRGATKSAPAQPLVRDELALDDANAVQRDERSVALDALASEPIEWRDGHARAGIATTPRPGSRALWTLVATSIGVNAALLVFAWRTSASLDENVAAFRSHLAAVVDAVRAETLHAAAPLAPAAVSPAPAEAASGLDPLGVDALLQLRFAREELAAGEYGAARQRLYRMLAIADATSDPEAEAHRAGAAYLIGTTFHAQSRALREEDAR